MNYIYWQHGRIGIFTNTLNTEKHSHWMLQLFLSLNGQLKIEVNEKEIKCKCIVVDKNIPHSIDADNKMAFSALIAPTSLIARTIQSHTGSCGYWVCEMDGITSIQESALDLATEKNIEKYLTFSEKLCCFLNVKHEPFHFDPRIELLLQLIENCDCNNHAISGFADKVSLSPSRLSHLFKAETGMPLKSYIMLHQVERAFIKLLCGKNITEAALEAGFDSSSHFSATVKRMMGIPASLSTKDSVFLKVPDIQHAYNDIWEVKK